MRRMHERGVMCRYLDSRESRTDHDATHGLSHLEPELPVSDLQPISDARSITHTSDSGAHSVGHGTPADGAGVDGAGPAEGAASLHPFVFDAFRAVRLAKAHGKRSAARRILVELHAFEAAIELASNYAEGLAVVEEVRSCARAVARAVASVRAPSSAEWRRPRANAAVSCCALMLWVLVATGGRPHSGACERIAAAAGTRSAHAAAPVAVCASPCHGGSTAACTARSRHQWILCGACGVLRRGALRLRRAW